MPPPAFQGDIASLGEIPRYRIAVSLDADALTLTGRQQVLYTNNESSNLGEIYFRLYPNLPQFGGQMQKATIDGQDAPDNLPTSGVYCKNMPSVA